MIGVIGISHKSASVAVREKFSLTKDDIGVLGSLHKIRVNKIKFVVLSTCNRTEVYFDWDNPAPSYKSFSDLFHPYFQVNSEDKKHVYLYTKTKTTRHLFRVISGIESLAFGEDQIIKQVKDALSLAKQQKHTSSVLNRLFQKAFEASKKVRTQTKVSQGGYSISSAAVNLALHYFRDLTNCSVLLLGAGETSELVLKKFKKRGVNFIYIANRTLSKSEALAKKYGGIALKMEELNSHLSKTDILITSTSAGKYLITHSVAKELIHKNKPLCIIDISVPRNVESTVGTIKNVNLYNIDDLEKIVEHSLAKRKDEEAKASIIIDDITEEFDHWLTSSAVFPIIEHLKTKIDNTNKAELNRLKNKLSEEEFEKVSNYGNFITKKITNQIITKLREDYSIGNNDNCLKAVKLIFDLK